VPFDFSLVCKRVSVIYAPALKNSCPMCKLNMGQFMKPEKDQIADLSREEIAEKFGVSLRTAVRWQKHHGFFQPKYHRLNQAGADRIRQCHAQGWSAEDCAVAFDYSLTTIYRVLNNEIYHTTEDTAQISVSYNPN